MDKGINLKTINPTVEDTIVLEINTKEITYDAALENYQLIKQEFPQNKVLCVLDGIIRVE